MADLQKFLFDVDFDDVALMETIVQEEVEEKRGDSEAEEPEPEIIIPMFSEEDLEAARQEGFNNGKESGAAETLAGIENTMTQALNLITDQISELFSRQSEFNEQITNQSISLIKNVNRKLFPVMSRQGALDEAVEFSQELLSKLLTEPCITICAHEDIAEPLKQRVQQFLNGGNYRGDLLVSGDENITAGSCKVEWSSGSAEWDPELLLSEIEERLLMASDQILSPQTSKQAISDSEVQTGVQNLSATEVTGPGTISGGIPPISAADDEGEVEKKPTISNDENNLNSSLNSDPLKSETDATVTEAEDRTVDQHGSVNNIIEPGNVPDDTPDASNVSVEKGVESQQSNSNYEKDSQASSSADPLKAETETMVSEAEGQTIGKNGSVSDATNSGEIHSDTPSIADVDDVEGAEDQQSNSE